LSAREATGYYGFAALTVNNLKAIAQELHARYPLARIVVLADSGKQADIDKATEAAQSVSGSLVVPSFTEAEKEAGKNKDINDLHRLRGLEEVRRQIDSAVTAEGSSDVHRPTPLQRRTPEATAFPIDALR
jgi:putative DNA primase/helicase